VLESRGGSVLFDPGALGGLFVGCMFFDDMSGEEEVELIVELNLALVSVRIYGGFIFIGGGTLREWKVLDGKWDLTRLTDRQTDGRTDSLTVAVNHTYIHTCVRAYMHTCMQSSSGASSTTTR